MKRRRKKRRAIWHIEGDGERPYQPHPPAILHEELLEDAEPEPFERDVLDNAWWEREQ